MYQQPRAKIWLLNAPTKKCQPENLRSIFVINDINSMFSPLRPTFRFRYLAERERGTTPPAFLVLSLSYPLSLFLPAYSISRWEFDTDFMKQHMVSISFSLLSSIPPNAVSISTFPILSFQFNLSAVSPCSSFSFKLASCPNFLNSKIQSGVSHYLLKMINERVSWSAPICVDKFGYVWERETNCLKQVIVNCGHV